MSNSSIIEHRGNYHFVALREEYLLLCQQCEYRKPDTAKSKNKASMHCKALILDILEHWTNTKRDNGISLAIFMTYKQWSDSMYGMFGRNVIIDSLDELIGEGLVTKEPYRMHGKDTFQYFLNHQEINKRMRALPEKAIDKLLPQKDAFTSKPENGTHLQVNANGFTNKRVTDLLVNEDAFTSNHNIDTTKITFIDSSKNTERDSASANNVQSSSIKQDSPTSQKLLNEKIERFRMTFIALGKEYFAYDKFIAGKISLGSDLATRILEIVGEEEVDTQGMRQAFLKLWNSQNRDGSYWWRDKSKLTLRAFVNNYDDQAEVPQRTASTPGSQYIVDELSEVAEAQLAAMPDTPLASFTERKQSKKATLPVKNVMKGCFNKLNHGIQDESALERAQQMYVAAETDLLTFREKVDQATRNTEIYVWDRSEEEKMDYFFKALEKALGLQCESVAQ